MYSICKTTHPATGIEHAINCYFFTKSEKCLVVSGANVIRVFRLIADVSDKEKLSLDSTKPPKMKLECLAQYILHGNIMSMQSVRLVGSQRDSLLLSFRDAKLSIVEYDPESHDLKTVSLHYFEEEEMRGGWTNHHHIQIVRVDPEGRCAVMLIYGKKLVVLPFRKEATIDENDLLEAQKPSSNKTPILSSYMIVLKNLEEKMDNVIDLQFLHGYYEPTLLILYEPVRTFAGRIAVRQDTCAMVAISLNIQQKVHPIIWQYSNLPFDCFQAVAVKKPLGGTLIMAVNSLIYLNQSIPPYGVSLNSLTESSTNFPMKPQEGVKLSLESAQVAFISPDRLVLSLKTGELYVLSLFVDSMRSVRGFHFDKAASSVLTSCVCLCEENYLFLGSRLGNSLLLKFTEKDSDDVHQQSAVDPAEVSLYPQDEEIEIPVKRPRQDFLGDWMASNVSDIKDPEELEVYGNETQTSIQITSYSFEVCDSLLNIGPCGNISMGEPAFLSEEFAHNQEPDIELVTTSGYGKNGALCVIQRSIRPQVVTTFELPGCEDMWTVIRAPTTEDQAKSETDDVHGFLILSHEDSSMILQTGQEINEVDQSGFSTHGATIFAGNLGANRYIIQVTQTGVRLMHGTEQVQHMPGWAMDLDCPIVHASCADPYVVLLAEDGEVRLLTLKEGRGSQPLQAQKPNLMFRPQIESLCCYYDVSGLFTTQLPLEIDEETEKEPHFEEPTVIENIDNEDELLYGDAPAFQMPAPPLLKVSDPVNKKTPWWHRHFVDSKPTYWLFIYRDNGTLEIYSLPDLRLSYLIRNFGYGQSVMHDSMESTTIQSHHVNEIPNPEIQVREILMVALGHQGNRPLLFLRLDGEIQIYQVYKYPKGYLKMRFKKLDHGIITGCTTVKPKEEHEPRMMERRLCMMRYFRNIAGYNGVFISGNHPHWIFLTSRGELRIHPMEIDGPVRSFAPFNNVNCPQGFLYFNRKDELRICILPIHLSYDAPWPVRKVPLGCTPHFVTYHLESKTYCVVTSVSESLKSYYRFNGEDKEFTEEERSERFIYPIQEQFSIVLFSPVSWATIPNTKFDLDQWEHVTCLKNVALAYEGTRSGLKGYIVLGTNYNYGEDITSRGRILIFDIIEVVPEPGQPLTKNRFKQIYAKEQKGPITAISQVSGFLVSAVGQKIYIWQLKDNDLVGVAFIDTQIYIHQMISIKSLILVADVYKSISLLRFQEEYRTLSLVSRDFRPAEIYTIEYLIDNNNLGFLVSDGESNIALFMYQPESMESLGGQKLIRKADFHLGQKINSFFRIRCKVNDSINTKKQFSGADKRHVTMFATLDGSLGYILPVPEKSYRRLLMLQNVLVSHISHLAALNPKTYRTYKSFVRLQGNPARGIIDGDLIWKYLYLPYNERIEIAKKIGTRVPEIVEDITEISLQTSHF